MQSRGHKRAAAPDGKKKGRGRAPEPADLETPALESPEWARKAGFGLAADLAALGAGVARDDSPGPYGVLVEAGRLPAPGQVAREAFMQRLEARIRAIADAELAAVGRSAQDCPYLESWLAFYRDKPAGHIERAIRVYAQVESTAPEALAGAVEDRVRAAIRRWRETGELSAIPDQAPFLIGAKAADPGDPMAVAARLGPGEPLDPAVRARMERGLGDDLSQVRVHLDGAGAAAARQAGAPAIAVGPHVAFAPGEYRPGTLTGDAMLAHELAHTRQQRGATTRATSPVAGPSQEREADRAAARTLARVWGKRDRAPAPIAPGGGLALARCTPSPAKSSEVTADTSLSESDETFLESLEGTEDLEATFDLYKGNTTLGGIQALSPAVPGTGTHTAMQWQDVFWELYVDAGYDPGKNPGEREKAWKSNKDHFEALFQRVALGKAYEELDRHEKLVQGELDRYTAPAGLKEIRAALKPYQATLEKVRDERAAGEPILSQAGEILVSTDPPNAEAHRQAAKMLAQPVRQALVNRFPIVVAEDLDIERVLLAPDAEAQAHLMWVAKSRVDDIQGTRGALKDKPSRVWHFDRAVQLARQQMNIQDGSVYDLMIRDRFDREALDNMFRNLLIGGLALGLGLLSGGTGTVAVLAAAGGAGISVGLAAAHLRDFLIAQAATGTAFDKAQALSSTEPSLFWLALDVAVAFVDIGFAAKAFQTLKPIAKDIQTVADVEKLRAPAKQLATSQKLANPDVVAEQVVEQAKQHLSRADAIKAAEAADKAAVDVVRALVKDEAAINGLLKLQKGVRTVVLALFNGNALEKLGKLLDEFPQVAKTIEGLADKLPVEKFYAVMGKYLFSRGTQSKYLLRAAADAGLNDADFQLIADALKNVKSNKQVAKQIGGLLIDRIAERLPGGQQGIEIFRRIAPGLHPNQSAQIFERWAARNIYGQTAGAERFTADTSKLAKEYEAAKPNFQGERISTDNVVRDPARPNEAGIGDFKSHLNKRNLAADADAVKQADNYAEMLRVGVKTAKGEKFTWVEYLFANRDSAEASFKFLKGKFGDAVKVFFVDEKGAKTLYVPGAP